MLSKKSLSIFFKKYDVFQNVGDLSRIVIFFYGIRVLASAWLAFDISSHPLFQLIVATCGKVALISAILYIVIVQKNITKQNALLCVLPSIYVFLIILEDKSLGYFMYAIVSILAIYIFLLLNNDIKKRILNFFYYTVIVSIIVCFVMYIMVLSSIPLPTCAYYTLSDTYLGMYYYQLGPFAVLNSGGLLRMCGIFNEGGNLGTICAFLYAIYHNRSSKIEKIILISGIVLSFSLAGYLLLFVYWMIYYIGKKQLKGSMVCLAIVLVLLVLPNIDFGNPYINTFVQRFSITSEGLAGDNRTWSVFDAQYESIVNSTAKWWGVGLTAEIADGSSYKSIIMQFGYIGFYLLLLPWIFYGIRYAGKNWDALSYMIVFFVSLYQRPAPLTSLFGYAFFFVGLLTITNLNGISNIKLTCRL